MEPQESHPYETTTYLVTKARWSASVQAPRNKAMFSCLTRAIFLASSQNTSLTLGSDWLLYN